MAIIYMTKQMDDSTPDGRDRPVEIEITPEMIEAGVMELREHSIGECMEDIVEAVWVVMNAAR